tara:strand:+ start:2525 stop:3364 length:840 start_codon:yes stop_codon:yes gene_type:complete
MRALGIIALLLITGCASVPMYNDSCTVAIAESIGECREAPEIVQLPTYEQLLNFPPAEQMPIVAVYNFKDLTGQRKRRDNLADFSTAVTQGATELLIDALKTAGKGRWFRVVERHGIDHLVRERQIVRSTREENDTGKGIQPLLFAGIIFEGGIIGYDSNIESGGRGARTLGIGMQQSYRRDVVTVSLRGISTLTGEILLNVQTKKTILSVGGGFDVFKFVDMDTQLVEIEDGVADNESVTVATRAAIEAAVVGIIEQGDERGFWKIQRPKGDESEETK